MSSRLAHIASRGHSPIKDIVGFRRQMASICMMGTFVILAGCTAYLAKPILLPVVAAVIIGCTIGSLADKRSNQRQL